MINQIRKWWRQRKSDYVDITPAKGRPLKIKKESASRFEKAAKIEDILAPTRVDNIFPNILTFNITSLGYCPNMHEADEGEVWAMLVDIYDKILREDPFWHFFYERAFIHIRCSDNFVGLVCDYLDDLGAVYTQPKVWIDGSDTVKNYHTIFTYLFHGFSVLAMEYEDCEFHVVMDRVIHCFMNHQWFRSEFQLARQVWGEFEAEAMLIAKNSVARANYNGWCEGVIQMKEKYKLP